MAAVKRLIFIDPSICGSEGHYLEYASAVLRKACMDDYVCVMAVNRRFQEKLEIQVKICRVFQYTFWDILGSCPYYQDYGSKKAKSQVPVWKRVIKNSCQKMRVHRYQKELKKFLQDIRPMDTDVFLIPTISHLELLAFVKVCKELDIAYRSIHVLFRRPLFEGKQWERECRNPFVKDVCTKFKKAKEEGLSHVFYYTDTDCLSAQYNYLRIFRFGILPIPHAREECLPIQSQKIHIGVLGGAREEKGFCSLSDIIEKLDKEQAVFTIQVQPFENSAAVLQTIKRLRQYPKQKVTLLGRLSGEAYGRYIEKMDIMLLLYDKTAYAARSSGVFVEAVTAGCMVVTTQGTWMAGQIQMFWERYQLKIGEVCHDTKSAVKALHRIIAHMEEYQSDLKKAGAIYRGIHNAENLLRMIGIESSKSNKKQ